jgi:hypothetical protein
LSLVLANNYAAPAYEGSLIFQLKNIGSSNIVKLPPLLRGLPKNFK